MGSATEVLCKDQVLSGYLGASWGGGGGGVCLRQHTKVAVRPHMVLDTKRQPSPESNLKCLFVRTLSL